MGDHQVQNGMLSFPVFQAHQKPQQGHPGKGIQPGKAEGQVLPALLQGNVFRNLAHRNSFKV
jgi:hypothetical protein